MESFKQKQKDIIKPNTTSANNKPLYEWTPWKTILQGDNVT